MSETQNDIRGVLIQVAGARLLLPNANIAEVMAYVDPEPVENAPEWLLGRIRWRGWRLPLVAFARLTGIAEEVASLGNKVVVLKALSGDAKTPYFALLTQGFPRLVTIARTALSEEERDPHEMLPTGVRARIVLNEEPALLPDLESVESMIGEALAAAA